MQICSIPPECLPRIIRAFEEGNEVISMVRTRNKSAGLIKNITSSGFYWLINCISDVHFEPNASDFFAVSRSVAEVLKGNYREKVRFLRGYVQNVGFQKTTLEYEAGVRVAGESKYSLKKLFIFSVNTILCFSNMPLKLGIYAGILSGAAGMAVLVYTLFTRQGAPSGYATIVVLICFMFAMMFLLIGIIGEYIAILFYGTEGSSGVYCEGDGEYRTQAQIVSGEKFVFKFQFCSFQIFLCWNGKGSSPAPGRDTAAGLRWIEGKGSVSGKISGF